MRNTGGRTMSDDSERDRRGPSDETGLSSGAALSREELDFVVAQSMRVRTELIDQFGERAPHIYAMVTMFSLGDLLTDQNERASVADAVNRVVEAAGYRLVPIN
jgi:hypothetical protein